MAKVLVAYATKTGSTREVAERVGKRLSDKGLQVDVRGAGEVRSLNGYDAVVFGGALYMFRLIGEGRRFLARSRKQLSGLPFAAFGMGPLEDTEEQFTDARRHLDKTLDRLQGVTPKDVTIFGGALDPAKLKFPFNNPAMKNMPASDLRDWKTIEAWADSLPAKLGLGGG